MTRLLLLSLIGCLAGCDMFYCVTHLTPIPAGFDPAAAEIRLREGPDCFGGRGWDGEQMFLEFERDEARAFVSVCGSELRVGSCWTGRVPDLDALHMALDLQARLIRLLREISTGIPLEPEWHLHAEPDEMDAQVGAAAERHSR